MRNPNHYGSVVKLSGKRRRPYAVRAGVTEYDDRGYPIYKIIGYTTTREEGMLLLAKYNGDPWNVDAAKMTVEQLYTQWREKRGAKLSKSNQSALRSAHNYVPESIRNLPYRSVKAFQMQETIDNCGMGYGTQGGIKNLWHHLDQYALELDIVSRCYSELLKVDPTPPTSRKPFTKEEIQKIWDNKDLPWVDTVLILLYTGWRITELISMKKEAVDLKAGTMTGGIKTKAGKNRVVPIHHLILPFVKARMKLPGEYLIMSPTGKGLAVSHYRDRYWKSVMDQLGINHIPHECRHTIRSALDAAGANHRCMDLIMGHASKGVGDQIYTHKTLQELKDTIELVTY